MKLQKEALEKTHSLELAKDRTEHTRSIQELRVRLAEFESKVEEGKMTRVMLESELHKKEILYSKSLENY